MLLDFVDLISGKLVKLQNETIIDLDVGSSNRFFFFFFLDVICSLPQKKYMWLRLCLGGD